MRAPDDEPEVLGAFDLDGFELGCGVSAQVPFGPYRVDFCFVNPCSGDALVVVEIDEGHHRHQWYSDLARDRWFTLQRIAILRFTEREVQLEPERCAFIAAWYADWLLQSEYECEGLSIDAWSLRRERDRLLDALAAHSEIQT